MFAASDAPGGAVRAAPGRAPGADPGDAGTPAHAGGGRRRPGAARHGASREESLASTDFRDLNRADDARAIEALMRRFARRLKHLQLRREARFHHGRRLDLQGTIRRSVASGGTPIRLAWRSGAASGRGSCCCSTSAAR